ncbi:hypothetical protein ECZU29_31760 [Escherichia coli]|nr:hypothetical protein ECZU29_31760 [Escherichia coli]
MGYHASGGQCRTVRRRPGTPATAPTDGGGADWLTSTPAPNVEHFNILDPFHKTLIPLDSWVTEGIDWVVTHFRPVFQGVRVPVDYILNGFQQLLLGMPAPVAIIVFALIAWQISGVGMGVATLVSLIAIGAIGAWSQAMVTLALVLTALLFCIVIGLPLGIWLARSPRAAKIIRPLLDAMQTTPAFVYLVPIVMLFGIGNVPGVVVTIIFALPPIIRLDADPGPFYGGHASMIAVGGGSDGGGIVVVGYGGYLPPLAASGL